MTSTIRLSPDLDLPIDAITQKLAFIARSGAGKTYAASKCAEEMLAVGAQVVVLDPVGVWWGLRLSHDGKRKGIAIPVFGGEHGDVPLEPGAGAMVADLVVEHAMSVVLDVSGFTQGEMKRFLTAFAERLFQRKKATRTPMHFFLEEAQTFVPQRALGEDARMLGAFERICKLGRNFGIGVTLISQRPQAVHKDVLNQTEALFVGQVNGAQERKALAAWVVEQSGDKTMVDDLPGLPIGTMYLWSPQWLKTFRKVQIGLRSTFNASATPVFGAKAAVRTELAPVDLDAIREAMKETVERAEQDDPRALRKTIAELRAKLQHTVAKPIVEIREVPVITPDMIERLELAIAPILLVTKGALHSSLAPSAAARKLSEAVESMDIATGLKRRSSAVIGAGNINGGTYVHPRESGLVQSTGNGKAVTAGARKILAAVGQHAPAGVTTTELTVLLGYKKSSRNTYLQRLRDAGFVEQAGEVVTATKAGLVELGADFERLPKGDALRLYWEARLPPGERAMLDVLCRHYPRPVERADFDRLTPAYKKSSRNTYLQRLGARKLVVDTTGGVRASDLLFDGAS